MYVTRAPDGFPKRHRGSRSRFVGRLSSRRRVQRAAARTYTTRFVNCVFFFVGRDQLTIIISARKSSRYASRASDTYLLFADDSAPFKRVGQIVSRPFTHDIPARSSFRRYFSFLIFVRIFRCRFVRLSPTTVTTVHTRDVQ